MQRHSRVVYFILLLKYLNIYVVVVVIICVYKTVAHTLQHILLLCHSVSVWSLPAFSIVALLLTIVLSQFCLFDVPWCFAFRCVPVFIISKWLLPGCVLISSEFIADLNISANVTVNILLLLLLMMMMMVIHSFFGLICFCVTTAKALVYYSCHDPPRIHYTEWELLRRGTSSEFSSWHVTAIFTIPRTADYSQLGVGKSVTNDTVNCLIYLTIKKFSLNFN